MPAATIGLRHSDLPPVRVASRRSPKRKPTHDDGWACGWTIDLIVCCDLLLRAEDRVFGGLGDAEFDDLLGRDLDLLAGGGVTAEAGLAVHQHQLPDARDGEAVL